MRHTNPNMVPAVLQGIEQAEALLLDDPSDGDVFWLHQRDLELLAAALVPTGDRPFVVGAFLKAKALARTQGFVAAWRSATEYAGATR